MRRARGAAGIEYRDHVPLRMNRSLLSSLSRGPRASDENRIVLWGRPPGLRPTPSSDPAWKPDQGSDADEGVRPTAIDSRVFSTER